MRTFLKEGQRFNKLTVIKLNHTKIYKRYRKDRNIYENIYVDYYLCKCDCGKECLVQRCNLRSGHTKSCGCIEKGNIKHRLHDTKLYRIYNHMKERCNNENCKSFKNYGGRGIKICKEWNNDFMSFYNWAINNGYQENLSIDRIDVNGNYEPNNCRWVDILTQANNKTNNFYIDYDNKKYTMSDLSRLLNIHYEKSRIAIHNGKDIEYCINKYKIL